MKVLTAALLDLVSTVSNVFACLCLPHCPAGRLCVHWSRMIQPGNRGWPSSWSRWWPSWVWRAEDHTSQGALGRNPIRNRAVPEWRPVPIFIMWLPPSAFQRWLLPWPFLASSSPRNILFSSSSLLHRLVYLNISEGWFRAEVGIPQCNVGDPSASPQGGLIGVTAWKLAILAYVSPPAGRREGENIFMLPSRIYTAR